MSVVSITERDEKNKKRKLLFSKLFRIVVALLVIVLIVGVVLNAIYIINAYRDSEIKVGEKENIVVDRDVVTSLDVEIEAIDFLVKKEGNIFSLSKHEYIEFAINNDRLVIREKGRSWFERVEGSVLLTVPEDYDFNFVNVESEGGKIELNNLNVVDLDLELGAGTVILNNVNVTRKMDIENGVGKVNIKKGKYNNLICKLNVGSLKFFGELTGNSEFETKFGSSDIKLIGNSNVYSVRGFKGLGDFIIGNYIINEDTIYGTGKTKVIVNGGVGGVVVKFVNEDVKVVDYIYRPVE